MTVGGKALGLGASQAKDHSLWGRLCRLRDRTSGPRRQGCQGEENRKCANIQVTCCLGWGVTCCLVLVRNTNTGRHVMSRLVSHGVRAHTHTDLFGVVLSRAVRHRHTLMAI